MYLVVSDIHLYESNSYRVKAFHSLLKKLNIYRRKFNISDLVICGDFFNKYTSISISSILKTASLFKKFKQVWLLCGNHDTPYRDTKESLLDIFSLLQNVRVINSSWYNEEDNVGFISYYQPFDSDVLDWLYNCKILFTHKDIKELNKFNDEDFAISLNDYPQDCYVFNGHLHHHKVMELKEGGQYIQLGAPYPTRFSDASELNRYVFLVSPNLKENFTWKRFPLNICAYEGHNLKAAEFIIPYSEKDKIEEVKLESLDEMRIQNMTDIIDAFEKLEISDKLKRIGRRIIEHVINTKIEPDKL